MPPGATMDAGLLGPERARGGAPSVLAWPVSCPVLPGS